MYSPPRRCARSRTSSARRSYLHVDGLACDIIGMPRILRRGTAAGGPSWAPSSSPSCEARSSALGASRR
eukprot:13436385-Heterocapsa_arctica.AAC.1